MTFPPVFVLYKIYSAAHVCYYMYHRKETALGSKIYVSCDATSRLLVAGTFSNYITTFDQRSFHTNC